MGPEHERGVRRWARGVALGACLLAGCARTERPAIVLVTLDTTRADALGAFGGPPGLTPALDALARRSRRFTDARTTAPMTLPAHASMLTGLYPPRHGLRDNGPMFLPSSARTLAEVAHDEGYETAAFVSALALDGAFGLAQGFDLYDEPLSGEASDAARRGERSDDDTASAAIDWLRGRDRSKPLFLWVHFFGPHAPYEPSTAFLDRAGGDAYLGEVAEMDAAFGRLADELERDGAMASACIAVAADHGEARFEHGEPTHALLCYDATLRVPLFVRDARRGLDGGESVAVVSVADLAPTLLAAMGASVPDDLDGVDLASAIPPARGVYFETYYGFRAFGWSPLAGWVDARGKYVHGAKPQFFDLRDDPGEEHDLYAVWDPRVLVCREEMARVLARPGLPPDEVRAAPEGALEAIGALGYATSPELVVEEFPDPLAESDRLAPQDRMPDFVAYNAADQAVKEGRPAEAIAPLEAIVAENPRNAWALDLLARARIETGDPGRALEVLVRRSKLRPELASTHEEIARCLEALGRDAGEVKRHLRRAMQLMAEAHERRGERELAASYRELLRRAVEEDMASRRSERAGG